MPDTTTAAASAASAAQASAFGASVGAGLIGGALMVILDPPATKLQMFLQSVTAGIGSIVFGPIAVRALDHYVDWVDLAQAHFSTVLEVAAPVYFVIGCLSWGIAAALVHLRHLIADRGADVVAERLGVHPADKGPAAPKP